MKELFELNWVGKQKAKEHVNLKTNKKLVYHEGEGVNEDNTNNLYIEGDNLDVLKLLKKDYESKVKMIYIDPPYNTGKNFIYKDNFYFDKKEYLDYIGKSKFSELTNNEKSGYYHSNWLSFMYPRLRLAKDLLTEDGVIFISIDDNEVDNLKKLCDEIFGEENKLGVISNISNPKGRSDDNFLATAHEYIILVAKNKYKTVLYGFEPDQKIIKRYNKLDSNNSKYREIDLRKTGDADLQEDRPEMFYYFYYRDEDKDIYISKEQVSKQDYREIIPLRRDGKKGRWRWGFNTASKNLDKLICRFMPDRKIWGVFEKDYLDGRPLVKSTTVWSFKDVNSERGSEEFIQLGFNKELFPRPKPVGTLKRAMNVGLDSNSPNDIILDFFSGSATTAHAVLEQNKEDGSNRKFIMVQLPEPCDEKSEAFKAGYKTIADIGKERIRRAINKLNEGKEDTLPLENKQDLGFKVFKLE